MRPCRRLPGRKALVQRLGSCDGRTGEIAPWLSIASSGRLRPEQHVGAGIVAAFDASARGDVDASIAAWTRKSVQAGAGRSCRSTMPRSPRAERTAAARRRAGAGRVIWVRSPVAGMSATGLARQARAHRRCRRAAPLTAASGRDGPLPAGVGQRDQMSGQIAAIDRRDVSRIQRTQIVACRTNCRNGRESAAGRLIVASVASSARRLRSVPDPAEVARADDRKQIEADIGRRGPVRERPAPGLPGNCPAAACGPPA